MRAPRIVVTRLASTRTEAIRSPASSNLNRAELTANANPFPAASVAGAQAAVPGAGMKWWQQRPYEGDRVSLPSAWRPANPLAQRCRAAVELGSRHQPMCVEMHHSAEALPRADRAAGRARPAGFRDRRHRRRTHWPPSSGRRAGQVVERSAGASGEVNGRSVLHNHDQGGHRTASRKKLVF